MLREFLNSLHREQEDNSFRYTDELVTPKTVFSCDKPSVELIELIDTGGLFPAGIKKVWETPKLSKQRREAKKLLYVTSVSDDLNLVNLDLGKFGIYKVEVRKAPKARRLDTKYMNRNPFIESGTYLLCLGYAKSLYNRSFYNKNYLECIKIIQEVLKSKDGEGFRKWSDC